MSSAQADGTERQRQQTEVAADVLIRVRPAEGLRWRHSFRSRVGVCRALRRLSRTGCTLHDHHGTHSGLRRGPLLAESPSRMT
ncbi:MAG: hypothetical protein U5L03_09275 [Burkholderiaceae bacterium]|nr:hypothetical protein [Burkholderiaceae bacterium]